MRVADDIGRVQRWRDIAASGVLDHPLGRKLKFSRDTYHQYKLGNRREIQNLKLKQGVLEGTIMQRFAATRRMDSIRGVGYELSRFYYIDFGDMQILDSQIKILEFYRDHPVPHPNSHTEHIVLEVCFDRWMSDGRGMKLTLHHSDSITFPKTGKVAELELLKPLLNVSIGEEVLASEISAPMQECLNTLTQLPPSFVRDLEACPCYPEHEINKSSGKKALEGLVGQFKTIVDSLMTGPTDFVRVKRRYIDCGGQYT